jgi:hypothetical protein
MFSNVAEHIIFGLPTYTHDIAPLCTKTFIHFNTHPATYLVGTGGSFPGGKSSWGCEDHHSPPSSAEVKEYVELYLHSPIHLHGVVPKLSTGITLLLSYLYWWSLLKFVNKISYCCIMDNLDCHITGRPKYCFLNIQTYIYTFICLYFP